MQSDVGTALCHKDRRPVDVAHGKLQQLKGQKAGVVLPSGKETSEFTYGQLTCIKKTEKPCSQMQVNTEKLSRSVCDHTSSSERWTDIKLTKLMDT
jgi:hypothetical protein